jgi:hypothetical protein
MQFMQKSLLLVVVFPLQSSPPPFHVNSTGPGFANAISTAVTNILGFHVIQLVIVRELQEHAEMITS